jgi:hypothetical protein
MSGRAAPQKKIEWLANNFVTLRSTRQTGVFLLLFSKKKTLLP